VPFPVTSGFLKQILESTRTVVPKELKPLFDYIEAGGTLPLTSDQLNITNPRSYVQYISFGGFMFSFD